jgi:acyl carrier protein phosphodiesterase
MNWLAHLLLSQPNGAHRLGNLFGDLVKGKERNELNSCFSAGIKCHLLIDRFTDNHLIFKQSKQRIAREHRRYSGVLVDVFYDHFLAVNWHDYAQVSLSSFTEDVYHSFDDYWQLIPFFPRMIINRMFEQDWLGSYYYVEGIEATLKRIKAKLSAKHQDGFLVSSFLDCLESNYVELERDFKIFFPEIISYIGN